MLNILLSQVRNGAGLVGVVSSLGYTLDSSPPDVGMIFDGPPTADGDVDYWTDGVLAAHWRGFSDPHTGILEYWWAVGTCAVCTDVQAFLSVGLNQGMLIATPTLT